MSRGIVGVLPVAPRTFRIVALISLAAMPWSEALETARAEAARQYLEEVLRRHGGRVAEAAAHAGVERESFYRLLRRYRVFSPLGQRRTKDEGSEDDSGEPERS